MNSFFVKKTYKYISFLLVLFFLIPLTSIVVEAKPVDKRIVKIGYYENNNFMSGASENSVKSGYAYEFIQKLQIYTNWKYEYVFGEYGDLYNKLINGEIDMLPGLAFTEDRTEKIYYPDQAMGKTNYFFLKRIEDNTVSTDIQSFSGKRIGTLSGAMYSVVKQLVLDNELEAEIVSFENISDRDNSLKEGLTDIIIVEGESTAYIDGLEPLLFVGENEVFLCVSKMRPDILRELNLAQDALLESNPMLISSLSETWYKNNIISSSLTAREREWVKNHPTVVIGYYAHCYPFAGSDENGNINGIVKDVVPEIFNKLNVTDIEYKYVAYDTFDELSRAIQNREVDMTCPAYSEAWSAENNNIATTTPFVSSYHDLIYLGEYPNMDDAVFAIQKSNKLLLAYKSVEFPNNEVLYCDTIFDCLDAVLKGKADCTILNTFSTNDLLKSKTKYTRLANMQLPGDVPYGFAVERSDHATMEILNHGISLLDDYYAESLTYKYYEEPQYTLVDLIRQNALTTAGILVVIAGIVVFLTSEELKKNKRFLENEAHQKKKLEESICQQEAQLQEITALNLQLEDNQRKLENQIDIIRSMSKIYFSSYYIDIVNDSLMELSSNNNVRQVVGMEENAQDSLYKMSETLITPEFEAGMKKFVDLSTLSERLKNTKVITFEFIGKNMGWSQMYFIEGDRDEKGKLLHVFIAARTIHEEKAREEEQKKYLEQAKNAAEVANNAKTAFLFNMSHDIRTPMNAIMGFRDLLEKNQDNPEKRKDYLRKIDDASNVLLSIINNVLEMARIEKGTLEVDETAWGAEQFNDTLCSVFDEMMKQKGITFTRSINVQHQFVYCDPIKLREVFLNILSNAYKYTPSGGRVMFDLTEIPCEIEGWVLYRTTVSDTGIGMSEEFIPHIFEEFSREKTTTDIKIEGTGLGMPIVKKLVDFMDGTIEVHSKKGEGSSFIVTIPHRIAAKSSLIEQNGVELDPKLFAGKRILLAEDNDLNAEIATEILGDVGFKIDHAEDGKICVQMMSDAAPGYYDLILMDVQMPNMNGYEATRAIRIMEDYKKATIPILAMTANAFEEDKREAMRAGMNGHLSKPINVKMLMRELARVLTDRG